MLHPVNEMPITADKSGAQYLSTSNLSKCRMYDSTYNYENEGLVLLIFLLQLSFFVDLLHHWHTKQINKCIIKFWQSLNLWNLLFYFQHCRNFLQRWFKCVTKDEQLWFWEFLKAKFQALLVLSQFFKGRKGLPSFLFHPKLNSIRFSAFWLSSSLDFSSLDIGAQFHLDRGSVDAATPFCVKA